MLYLCRIPVGHVYHMRDLRTSPPSIHLSTKTCIFNLFGDIQTEYPIYKQTMYKSLQLCIHNLCLFIHNLYSYINHFMLRFYLHFATMRCIIEYLLKKHCLQIKHCTLIRETREGQIDRMYRKESNDIAFLRRYSIIHFFGAFQLQLISNKMYLECTLVQ